MNGIELLEKEYRQAKAEYIDAKTRLQIARLTYKAMEEHALNSYNRLQAAEEALPPGHLSWRSNS